MTSGGPNQGLEGEPTAAIFRALSEASSAITFIYRGERNVYANPAAELATGYTRSELRELQFWDVIHEDSRELVKQRGLARQRGEPVPATYEVKIKTKSGEARWLDFTGALVDLDGTPAVMGTAFDVTERVRFREALERSEAQYRSLVENALVGVLRTNRAGEILLANEMTLRIFGFDTLEDLRREGMAARYVDQAERDQLLTRLRADGKVEQFEVRFRRKDGEVIRVEASIALDGDELSGVLLDVTERKRLERVALRSQQLDSLAVLAGGLAHDFNNFLCTILSNLSLLRLSFTSDAPAPEFLEEAERACERARGLTAQLLTLAKGGGEPRRSLLALPDLLTDAVGFALRGSNVSCEWSLAEEIPPVHADEDQLAQLVHNLILNAVQAMPQGGTVRVSASHAEGWIEVSFVDEGQGIPPDVQSRIFDPYFSTKSNGRGLGLASARSIAQHHGGSLRAESVPGGGGRLLLRLPAAGPEAQASVDTPPGVLEPDGCGPARVLVMDDDEPVRRSTCSILRAFQHEVSAVEDGAAAVEAYERARAEGRPFDLVLLDLVVPGGMGGVEALERLVQVDPAVRAVIVTGFAEATARARCEELGASGWLGKPFTVEQLTRCLARTTRGVRSPD